MKTFTKNVLLTIVVLMPLAAALAMVGAAWDGQTNYVIAFGVLYLATVIRRAADRIVDSTIAASSRHEATIPRRVRMVREAMER